MPLLEQSLVDSVIKRALRSGADFVELFVERKRNQSISVEESKVQRVNSGNDLGAGLRIIHQGTVSYVYTEDLSEDGLLKTADLAAQIGRRGGGRFAFAELSGAPRPPQRIDVPPETIGPEAKIELLLEADQAARGVAVRSSRLRSVMARARRRCWSPPPKVRVTPTPGPASD